MSAPAFKFPRKDIRPAFRRYTKALHAFLSGSPSVSVAAVEFEKAYEQVIAILEDTATKAAIEPSFLEQQEIVHDSMNDSAFIKFETGIVRELTSIRTEQAASIVSAGFENYLDGARIVNYPALVAYFTAHYNDVVIKTNETRGLKRKAKKEKKKKILASSVLMVGGVSAIVGNSFTMFLGIYTPLSVGAGAGAVIKGVNDLYLAV